MAYLEGQVVADDIAGQPHVICSLRFLQRQCRIPTWQLETVWGGRRLSTCKVTPADAFHLLRLAMSSVEAKRCQIAEAGEYACRVHKSSRKALNTTVPSLMREAGT